MSNSVRPRHFNVTAALNQRASAVHCRVIAVTETDTLIANPARTTDTKSNRHLVVLVCARAPSFEVRHMWPTRQHTLIIVLLSGHRCDTTKQFVVVFCLVREPPSRAAPN